MPLGQAQRPRPNLTIPDHLAVGTILLQNFTVEQLSKSTSILPGALIGSRIKSKFSNLMQ
jgi:hypothetical protein